MLADIINRLFIHSFLPLSIHEFEPPLLDLYMAEQKKEKTPSTETKAREKLYDFKFMESLLGGDWPLFIECVVNQIVLL